MLANWEDIAPKGLSFAGGSCTTAGKNIWCIGGIPTLSNSIEVTKEKSTSQIPSNYLKVSIFSVDDINWSSVAVNTNKIANRRHHSSVAFQDDKILVFGGVQTNQIVGDYSDSFIDEVLSCSRTPFGIRVDKEPYKFADANISVSNNPMKRVGSSVEVFGDGNRVVLFGGKVTSVTAAGLQAGSSAPVTTGAVGAKGTPSVANPPAGLVRSVSRLKSSSTTSAVNTNTTQCVNDIWLYRPSFIKPPVVLNEDGTKPEFTPRSAPLAVGEWVNVECEPTSNPPPSRHFAATTVFGDKLQYLLVQGGLAGEFKSTTVFKDLYICDLTGFVSLYPPVEDVNAAITTAAAGKKDKKVEKKENVAAPVAKAQWFKVEDVDGVLPELFLHKIVVVDDALIKKNLDEAQDALDKASRVPTRPSTTASLPTTSNAQQSEKVIDISDDYYACRIQSTYRGHYMRSHKQEMVEYWSRERELNPVPKRKHADESSAASASNVPPEGQVDDKILAFTVVAGIQSDCQPQSDKILCQNIYLIKKIQTATGVTFRVELSALSKIMNEKMSKLNPQLEWDEPSVASHNLVAYPNGPQPCKMVISLCSSTKSVQMWPVELKSSLVLNIRKRITKREMTARLTGKSKPKKKITRDVLIGYVDALFRREVHWQGNTYIGDVVYIRNDYGNIMKLDKQNINMVLGIKTGLSGGGSNGRDYIQEAWETVQILRKLTEFDQEIEGNFGITFTMQRFGFGELRFGAPFLGLIYKGNWESDKIQGKGELFHQYSFMKYSGSFADGTLQGFGRLCYGQSNLHNYSPSISLAAAITEHCQDPITNICQFFCTGARKPVLSEGKLKISLPEMYVFEGDFEMNFRHGNGVLFHVKQEFTDRNDIFSVKTDEKTVIYQGQWANNKMCGDGVMKLPLPFSKLEERSAVNNAAVHLVRSDCVNGVYNGTVVDYFPNSLEAVCEYDDGSVYTGGWRQGYRNGYGTMLSTAVSVASPTAGSSLKSYGEVYVGKWVHGDRAGFGSYKNGSSGDLYVGLWQNNTPYEVGNFYYSKCSELKQIQAQNIHYRVRDDNFCDFCSADGVLLHSGMDVTSSGSITPTRHPIYASNLHKSLDVYEAISPRSDPHSPIACKKQNLDEKLLTVNTKNAQICGSIYSGELSEGVRHGFGILVNYHVIVKPTNFTAVLQGSSQLKFTCRPGSPVLTTNRVLNTAVTDTLSSLDHKLFSKHCVSSVFSVYIGMFYRGEAHGFGTLHYTYTITELIKLFNCIKKLILNTDPGVVSAYFDTCRKNENNLTMRLAATNRLSAIPSLIRTIGCNVYQLARNERPYIKAVSTDCVVNGLIDIIKNSSVRNSCSIVSTYHNSRALSGASESSADSDSEVNTVHNTVITHQSLNVFLTKVLPSLSSIDILKYYYMKQSAQYEICNHDTNCACGASSSLYSNVNTNSVKVFDDSITLPYVKYSGQFVRGVRVEAKTD